MKVNTLPLLVVAVAGILLAACGGDQDTGGTPSPSIAPAATPTAQVETATRVPTGPAEPRIYVARKDGTGQEVLSAGYGPRWSPDGQRIAFVSGSGNLGFSGAIYTIDPDGQERTVVGEVSYPDHIDLCRAGFAGFSWSPDGSQVAFDTDSGQNVEKGTYIAPADGSSPPTYFGRVLNPTWSPDGQHLAFSGYPASSDYGCTLFIARLPGGEPQPLTVGWMPTWSPDGTRIAFARRDGVYVINADGGRERRVSQFQPEMPWPRVSLAWSPDAQRLAFDTGSRVYVADVTGDQPTADLGWGATPMWFPDGRRLAVVSYEYGKAVIYILTVEGSRQQLISLDAREASLSRDASRIVFTR